MDMTFEYLFVFMYLAGICMRSITLVCMAYISSKMFSSMDGMPNADSKQTLCVNQVLNIKKSNWHIAVQ